MYGARAKAQAKMFFVTKNGAHQGLRVATTQSPLGAVFCLSKCVRKDIYAP